MGWGLARVSAGFGTRSKACCLGLGFRVPPESESSSYGSFGALETDGQLASSITGVEIMADLIDAYSRTEEGKGVVQKIEEQVNAMKTRGDVIQAVACPKKMNKAAKRQRDWENRVRRERTDVGSANQATGDDIAAGAVDEEYAGCLRVTFYVLGYVETTKSWYEKAEPG